MKRKTPPSERQRAQQALVEQARALPGVAEVVDLYARLGPYVEVVNAQPGPVRNATGGNA